jgi:hypothetical protein
VASFGADAHGSAAADAVGFGADGDGVADRLYPLPPRPVVDGEGPRVAGAVVGAAAGGAAAGFGVTPTVTARNSSTTPALQEIVIDTSTGPWWNTTGTAWLAPTDVTVFPPTRRVAFWPSRLTNVTLLSAGTLSRLALGCDLQTSMLSTLPPLNSTAGVDSGSSACAAPAINTGPALSAAAARILAILGTTAEYITIQRLGRGHVHGRFVALCR